MSFYDEYGDMVELNDFYSAMLDGLEGKNTVTNDVQTTSTKFPDKMPLEYPSDYEVEELIDEDKMPF
jgi:hypothetical protein